MFIMPSTRSGSLSGTLCLYHEKSVVRWRNNIMHSFGSFMSSLDFIRIAQQIQLIFIVVIRMKVLRKESKGKATNNLLTLHSVPFLFRHVRKTLCLKIRAVDLAPPKEKSTTVALLPKRLIKKECSVALASTASN